MSLRSCGLRRQPSSFSRRVRVRGLSTCPSDSEGAERRETRGPAGPRGGRRNHPRHALRGVPPPLAIEEARLPALHMRLFFGPGPRFLRWHLRHGQPAPGGGIVVSPRWSPGSPEGGMPAARGNRILLRSSGCLRKAPLNEQDTRSVRQDFGAGITFAVGSRRCEYDPKYVLDTTSPKG